MMKRSTLMLLLVACLSWDVHAQTTDTIVPNLADSVVADTVAVDTVATDTIAADNTNQISTPTGRPGAKKWEAPQKEKIYFFSGFAVSADFVGLVMKIASSTFSQLEIAARINLWERVFPIMEIGIAQGDRTGNSKENIFHTSAPYFRGGFDINVNKKRTSNRLMFGLRVGYSSFEYDYTGPSIKDPVWGETVILDMKDVSASALWLEGVIGFETKIWSFIRLGWNVRYKFRMSQKCYEYGQPWYIPGYGPNGANCWGGTVNLIFDFGRTMKKGK